MHNTWSGTTSFCRKMKPLPLLDYDAERECCNDSKLFVIYIASPFEYSSFKPVEIQL